MTIASFHKRRKYYNLITALMKLHRYEIRFVERIFRTLWSMLTVPGIFLLLSELMTGDTLTGVAREIFEASATKVETCAKMR